MTEPEDKPQYLCISYVPLLSPDSFQLYEGIEGIPEEIKERISECEQHAIADACLWVSEDGKGVPVFALKKAREITEHLVHWAEGKPEEWFSLYLVKHQNKYMISLVPNLQKSIGRFKLNTLMTREEMITDERIIFIYLPLRFFSKKPGTPEKIQIGEETSYLGLIDTDEVNHQDLQKTPDPTFLGPFPIGKEEAIIQTMKKDISEMGT